MISWSGLLNQLSLLSFRDCGPLHEIPEHRIFNERGTSLVGFKCTICDHEDAKFLPAKGSSCSLEVVRARYQKHLKDAHDGNEFKCHLCSSAFKAKTSKKSLKAHLWTRHGIKCTDRRTRDTITYLRCNYTSECEFRSIHWRVMGHHIARLHLNIKAKKLSCTQNGCGQEFILFHDFHAHMCEKHNIEPEPTFENCFNYNHDFSVFSCHQCAYTTGSKPRLEDHIRIHHTTSGKMFKNFQCYDCGDMFTSSFMLDRHLARMHTEVNATCDLCPGDPSDKKLYTERSLKEHKREVHRKYHTCTRCDKKFPRANMLYAHFRSDHLSCKRFKCKLCKAEFGKLCNARYHYIELHCKDMFSKTDRVKLKKLTETFWTEHNAIQDLSKTDPDYPHDDYIKTMLKNETPNETVQQQDSSKVPQQKSSDLENERNEIDAAVQSIQVDNESQNMEFRIVSPKRMRKKQKRLDL